MFTVKELILPMTTEEIGGKKEKSGAAGASLSILR